MSHPHLDRAPIVEALVDLRVDPELSSLQALEPFQQAAARDFPDQRRVMVVTSNVDLRDQDAPKITTPLPDTKGYAFWSEDKRRVIQGRVNGFSFSHLGQYDRWETLRTRSKQCSFGWKMRSGGPKKHIFDREHLVFRCKEPCPRVKHAETTGSIWSSPIPRPFGRKNATKT